MKKLLNLSLIVMLLSTACASLPAPIESATPIGTATLSGRAPTRSPLPSPSPSTTITSVLPTVTPTPLPNLPTINAPTAIPQYIVDIAVSPSQVDGSYVWVTGPTQVTAFAPGAVRVEFLTAPTGTGATPQLEYVDSNSLDGWSWFWQTPRGGSHLWAEAVYANGTRIASSVLLILLNMPSPTPVCETHTAAVQVEPSVSSVQVGQQLVVQVTLLNQGCVELGQPQYALRVHAPQGQPLFIPPVPDAVTHDLIVAPGQSDSVEFVLQAAQIGSGSLQASVSFEVHINYPGPAYRADVTSAPVNIAVTGNLKPPDSDQPASGICDPLAGDIVTVNISADVPSPRCVKVTGNQRLQVVNATTTPMQVQLAQFNVQLQPGQTQIFDAVFGSYLAPGVHWLRITGGNGPEIWLMTP